MKHMLGSIAGTIQLCVGLEFIFFLMKDFILHTYLLRLKYSH